MSRRGALHASWTWVLATTALTAAFTPGAASANARRTAMGGVATARDGGGQANVAFRAIPPAAGQPRVIPLPLGLAQVAIAPPTFDPDDPDFSAVEIVNMVLEPPMDIRLTSPPSGEEAGIEVRVAEDEITLDLGEAKSLVPADPFERAGRFATDLFHSGVGFFEFGLAPLLVAHTNIDFSEDLHLALSEGAPLTSSGVYTIEPDAEVQAAMALSVGVAGQVAGARLVSPEDEPPAADVPAVAGNGGWRLYAGAGFKPLFGMAYFRHEGVIEVIPAEPLLDPDDPTDVIVHSIVRTSAPGSPAAMGQGFALDVGIAALHGSGWEVGLGVNDLAGSIRWRTKVLEVTLDETTGELITRTIAENEGHRSRLEPQATLNLARHWQRLTVAGDVRHGIDGTSWHLGTEKRLGRLFALRGGALLDGAGQLQGSGGGGVRMGPVGLDAALATSSANLAEKRALLLGLSLALY